jgi:manganese transport protein
LLRPYIVELVFSRPELAPLSKGILIPSLPGTEAVFLAAGVLGATIMPHVIYLHSSLTQYLHEERAASGIPRPNGMWVSR